MTLKKTILTLSIGILFTTLYGQSKVKITPIIDYPLGHVVSKLNDTDGNDISFKTATPWPWKRIEFNNMRLSLIAAINNKLGRVDYLPSVAFGNKAFLTFDDKTDKHIATNYKAWYFEPAFDIRIKLKDQLIKHASIPTITIGAGYIKNVSFRKKRGIYGGFFKDYFNYPETINKDLENVNSGFTFRFGLGLLVNDSANLQRSFLSLVYEHHLYDFFNQDYELDGVKPYTGMTTNIGALYLRLSINLARR